MNLIDLGIKSLLAGTLGWIAVSALRRSSAATRHTLLLFAIGGVCLLPVVSALLPAWHVPFFTVSEHTVTTPTVVPSTVVATTSTSAVPQAAGFSLSATVVLAALWAAGAAMLGIRLGVRLYHLAKTEREFDMNTDSRLQDLVSTQCKLSRRHVLLLQGPAGEPPMTWGQARPVLVLPEDAYEWPDDRLTSVVMHELAHIERSDWLISLVAEIACVVNWFNPFVWVMKRQLEIESEAAADDRVLSHGVSAVQYASHLVDVTRHLSLERSATHVALAMARPGKLETRVRAILEAQRCRRKLRGSITLAVAATVSGIVAVLATAAPTVVKISNSGAVPKLTSHLLPHNLSSVKAVQPLTDSVEWDNSDAIDIPRDEFDPESTPRQIPPAKRRPTPTAHPKSAAPSISVSSGHESKAMSGEGDEIKIDLSEISKELKKAGAEMDSSKDSTIKELQRANLEVQRSLANAHFPDKKFAEGIAAIAKASTQVAIRSMNIATKEQLESAAKALKSLPNHPKPPPAHKHG